MSHDDSPGMTSTDTHFVDIHAVEAWDRWFRWRDAATLHDVTIDETWRRVAGAVSAAEPSDREAWANQFCDAFSSWRLLPDERLLQAAGTSAAWSFEGALAAVLNIDAFVVLDPTPRLDIEALAAAAGLAVRLLDDACMVAGCTTGAELRIGVVGVANALHSLGIRYASAEAQSTVRTLAAAISDGCLLATSLLARDRGARLQVDASRLQRYERLGISAQTRAAGTRFGLRHARLTHLSPQPRLAQLANNVADALHPLALPAGSRRASSLRRPPSAQDATTAQTEDLPSLVAQLELRAAMQPWIDSPIDYPLLAHQPPDERELASGRACAERWGLPPPDWRLIA